MAGLNYISLPAVKVAVTGVVQPLTTNSGIAAIEVRISCPTSNAGNIFIGDSSVSSTSKQGNEIVKGNTYVISGYNRDLIDVSKIYVDASNVNDVACITYLKRN